MNLLEKAFYRNSAVAATAAAVATTVTLDSAAVAARTLDSASDFDNQRIMVQALHVINQWASAPIEEGETAADVLLGMTVGIADENHDGEVTDDEQVVIDVALDAMFDYLLLLGASEADANALLGDWDVAAADRVRELVAASLPDGEEAEDGVVQSMVFTPADQEPVFDSATFDAAYRKVVAVRNGKKVRINKRIAGVVRLSPAQKVALRKARAKAFSAGAIARRARSMRLRKSSGM